MLLSETGTRGILTIPLSMASISEKSETTRGNNSIPSTGGLKAGVFQLTKLDDRGNPRRLKSTSGSSLAAVPRKKPPKTRGHRNRVGTLGGKTADFASGPVVPALDPRTPYSSRLSARSALFTDLQLLLDGRSEPLTSEEYRKLVVEENCLNRPSSAARRKLWEELRKRYLLD